MASLDPFEKSNIIFKEEIQSRRYKKRSHTVTNKKVMLVCFSSFSNQFFSVRFSGGAGGGSHLQFV
jgi:hypothetical protein